MSQTTDTTITTSSGTSTTIDPSVVGNDSTAVINVALENLHENGAFEKPDKKIVVTTATAIFIQAVLWVALAFLFYLSLKPLLLLVISLEFIQDINSKPYFLIGVSNPLILGLLSSIIAAVTILLTRMFFYRVKNWFPAGALFRGIVQCKDPCLIYTVRMKDVDKSGRFITPLPDYNPVNNSDSTPNNDSFDARQNIPWVTSTSEAQALSYILNVLGRVGRSDNIEITFPDKEYDRWDASLFSLGGNWKTIRALETCDAYFKFQDDKFILMPTGQTFEAYSPEIDIGLLQKMINPTNGLPVWVAMGYRGSGTVAASYALVRWWKYLGILYGGKPFGLLVGFDDRDGWQQSYILSIYPKPKWHAIIRHPFAWHMLNIRIRSLKETNTNIQNNSED